MIWSCGPGGVADKDGRLSLGDGRHYYSDVLTRAEGASEQVAGVLRSCGTHVRLVVARPVDPGDPSQHV